MGRVNRLSTASETGQSFTYAYDRQGNRWGTLPTCVPGSTTTCQYTFSNNQINNAGITYDLAGNVTYDGFHSYTYDFEGRILKVDGGTTTYSYNALGQRVAKVVSGTEGDFVLDQAGRAITGRIGTPTHPWYLSEVYAGNMHVATYANGTTAFPHTNWLGTTMASTGPSGSTIKTCSGYLPFGDGSNCTGSDGSSLGFTGLWSDSETLLDNTPNRNYQSLAGRWTTPDPAGQAAVDVTNPQSWNRYAYVTNNPLSLVDPFGLDACPPNDANCVEVTATVTPVATLTSTLTIDLDQGLGQPGFDQARLNNLWARMKSHLKFAANNGTNCTPGAKGCFNVPTLAQQCDARSGNPSSVNQLSTGISFNVSIVPGAGPVAGGNQQSFGANTNNYSYDGTGYGAEMGVSVQSVWAWGNGSWGGPFHAISLSAGPFSGSIFWTPGRGGWTGASFGLGVGTPGLAYETTNYTCTSLGPGPG